MVAASRSQPLIPPTLSHKHRRHRRHDLGDIIDWLTSMGLLSADASDPDSPNNTPSLHDDDNDDIQQEGDARRNRAVANSNMAQRPAFFRAPEADVGSDDVATVVHIVYKTLAPTFKGPIAGYSTLFEDDNVPPPTAAPRAPPAAQTPSPDPAPFPAPSAAPEAASFDSESAKSPNRSSSARTSASSRPGLSNTFRAVLGSPVTGQPLMPIATDRVALLPSPSRHSASGSAADMEMSSKGSADASSGSSPGVKTGIAFGVLGGVIAVVLLAYFLFNRRRKQAAARIRLDDGDEKIHSGYNAGSNPYETPSMRGDDKAPRISLRPIGQFTPVGLGTSWDRPSTSRSGNSANPFGIQSDRVPSTIAEEQSTRSNSSSPATLFESGRAPGSPFSQDALDINGRAVAAGAALGVATGTGLSRKTSMRKDGPNNVDLTLPRRNMWASHSPPSPAGTEFSMSSVPAGSAPPVTNGAMAIEAAGGPANSGVHRVELEFKPTLADEMELRIGDLVRLLRKYDDGWCLVIRLNRSQQGVVPRTCISSRPLKPRLAPGATRPGPPVNPSGQARGPGSANGAKPAPSEASRLRVMQSSGSTSPTGLNLRAQSPGLRLQGALMTPPPPGPPPPQPPPPPPGPPPPGTLGRKPVPGQSSGIRSNWLKEP
ncbi:hypothetical protein G6O67_000873 [Ophiocordyceps sinensis]|uniref:SH3 domain-containing protein n=1 Tax=Ophiocordyceps sinensis TaxID=72228 RepID=A0A8H4PZY9_9HYPO|nr:hypothetical protein G6O67_000873 [Ophiocordyceps sinensis]